ncbi:MAG: hypothetical protein PUF50_07335, partial [Erysipelotrichaceae bacterium]|nr:hypothetical protein [Erysipelotrichaceae bacterium]
MEQRSRSQKYQKLRESMALEAETIVKSNDLSRYAKQMEAFQTPTTQEFQFDKEEVVEGSRSRVHADVIKEQESQDIQNYKNDLQKDSEWIDQLLQENEKLMQDMKPEKREEPKAAP